MALGITCRGKPCCHQATHEPFMLPSLNLACRLPACPSSVPSFSTPQQLWSRPCSGWAATSVPPGCGARWRLEDVAERMGVSRFTVADVERGKPGTSIAAYLGALWVLGLLDQLAEVADPDRDGEGKALEAARQPGQAPRRHRFDDDF